MSKNYVARLILEASTGMHGEESKILADTWAEVAQQRAELLDALKELIECPRGKLQWENAQETVKRIDQ